MPVAAAAAAAVVVVVFADGVFPEDAVGAG